MGRGLRRSWGRLRTGVEGFVAVACFTAKKIVNFFRAAEAADPRGKSEELAVGRGAANLGERSELWPRSGHRTNAKIRNVLSTVYAPRRTERLPTTPVKSGENFLLLH